MSCEVIEFDREARTATLRFASPEDYLSNTKEPPIKGFGRPICFQHRGIEWAVLVSGGPDWWTHKPFVVMYCEEIFPSRLEDQVALGFSSWCSAHLAEGGSAPTC